MGVIPHWIGEGPSALVCAISVCRRLGSCRRSLQRWGSVVQEVHVDGVAATACIHCVLCGVLGLSDSPMYGVAQRGLGRAAYQLL